MLGSLQGILIANIWNNHYGWSSVIFKLICNNMYDEADNEGEEEKDVDD